jgi:hypothetical protein
VIFDVISENKTVFLLFRKCHENKPKLREKLHQVNRVDVISCDAMTIKAEN